MSKKLKIQKGSTVSGYLSGKRQYVKEVAIVSIDNPNFKLNASVDANGQFTFLNLPDGSYKVTPIPGGKFDLKSEPMYQIVKCQGQSYSVQFEIRGISEG